MPNDALKTTADALVAHCRNQTESEALATLYAPDVESVEAFAGPTGSAVSKGIKEIEAKHAWWAENFEVHGGSVDGPHLHGEDRFAVIFELDATNKATGERSDMKEVAVYTVGGDGKIVREEFFYTM